MDKQRPGIVLFRLFSFLAAVLLPPSPAWPHDFPARPQAAILRLIGTTDRFSQQALAASFAEQASVRPWRRYCNKWISFIFPEAKPFVQELVEFAIFIILLLSFVVAVFWICLLRRKMRIKIEKLRQEVQERQQAEAALRKSEMLLKNILETIPVGLWLADRRGNIMYSNPAGQDIWQGARYVGPERFSEYKAWWSGTNKRITPDEWAVTRVIRDGEASHEEQLDIECFDGSRKTILNWAVPILNAAQHLEGVVVVNQDITERLRIERDLIAERDFSKSLIETAQAIILVLNPDGTINSFNKYMEKISGYRLEEVQGKDWFKTFLPNSDWRTVRELFRKAVGDIQTAGNINPILTKDGQKRYISWYT